MSSYSIITDTGCDMPAALAQKLDISAVPLKVTIGSKTFDSTLSKLDIGNVSFYDMLRNGVDVKTASPSIDDYERYFKKELEKGKDVYNLHRPHPGNIVSRIALRDVFFFLNNLNLL